MVTLKNNAVVANSRDVAAYFEKAHTHVLRDIDTLVEQAPEAASNFGLCPYQSVEGGRAYRSFDMTRNGFTLLAMGFTGAKALSCSRKRHHLASLSDFVPIFQKPRAQFCAWATMSSREIAELVEARHESVKRTVERLAARGVITLPPLEETSFKDEAGKPQWTTEYRIGKRDTYVIVAQLSPEFTARLVDRWHKQPTFSPVFT